MGHPRVIGSRFLQHPAGWVSTAEDPAFNYPLQIQGGLN
jgi:hypothetical protein